MPERDAHEAGPADPPPDAPPRPRLVLASGSPRRAELLARLGLQPEVRPADVDETPRPGEQAAALVARLAGAKAAAAGARGRGDEVVLAADTVVVLDGRVLGKPVDRDDARAMLEALSGRSHEVVTGVAVVRGPVGAATRVSTTVRFRTLTDAEVSWYLDTGEPDDKAGGYGLQGAGAVLVDRIDGSDTAVIGLPLAETVALLREVGLEALTPGVEASGVEVPGPAAPGPEAPGPEAPGPEVPGPVVRR